MTENELKQLYFLNKETERLQKDLQELQQWDGCRSPIVTGMPRGSTSKGIPDYAAEIADLRAIINLNLYKIQLERSRLERYICGIEDAEMRLIFRLRHIDGMTWNEIAQDLSYEYESTPRKKHKKYIEKLADYTD